MPAEWVNMRIDEERRESDQASCTSEPHPAPMMAARHHDDRGKLYIFAGWQDICIPKKKSTDEPDSTGKAIIKYSGPH